jgi:hypothetical protein
VSKKVKCPSCDMPGDPEGDDYSLVTTYHGRPVLQCFWCESHILFRKVGSAIVLDLNHRAIRHLRGDLEHDKMVSLLLDDEEESIDEIAVIASEAAPVLEPMPVLEAEFVEPVAKPSARPRRARKPVVARPEPAPRLEEFEPAMFAESPEEFEPAMLAEAPVVDNTPALLRPFEEGSQTPISTETELVSSIPITARALDHDSLIHMAARVGWIYTPVRKVPEWMNFELPPAPVLSPLRTKLQGTINMIKYFRINAGTKDQRRAETLARRARLVEYRRRLFGDRLDALSGLQAIEYKPKAV